MQNRNFVMSIIKLKLKIVGCFIRDMTQFFIILPINGRHELFEK